MEIKNWKVEKSLYLRVSGRLLREWAWRMMYMIYVTFFLERRYGRYEKTFAFNEKREHDLVYVLWVTH